MSPSDIDFYTPGDQTIRLDYLDYVRQAEDADLLLWTPRSIYGRMIARYTGGPFCHITAMVKWGDRPMSVGYDEKRGGVAEPLEAATLRSPGDIHVYRHRYISPEDRTNIAQTMLDTIGWAYEWGNIRLLVLTYLPFIRVLAWTWLWRWFAAAVVASSKVTREGICSQHVARSYEKFGWKFINKPSAVVNPNDIGMSSVLIYIGTLYPCDETLAKAKEKEQENSQVIPPGSTS